MDLLEIRKKAKEMKGERGSQEAAVPEETSAKAEAPSDPPEKKAGNKGRPKRRANKTAVLPDAAPEKPEPLPAEPASPAVAAGPSGPEERKEAGRGAAEDKELQEEEATEYLAFMLAGEEYAVKVENVREIIRPQHITAVPRAPEFILGIISLRGVIIPVFDIRKRLGLTETEQTRSTRILVVSDGGSPHGITVDRVTGVARLGEGDIEPPPAVIGGVDAEYLEGVGRVSGRLLILFNAARMLSLE